MSSFVAGRGSNSRIVAAYRQRTPGSAELARRAAELLPSGIAHDARHLDPYHVYIDHAAGAHKWDVDGNRMIDFFGGHGALLLGHCHPVVTARVAEAVARGTQFGANHPGEVRWAEAIRRLVPTAERVRFTSSGTEATLLAVRLARAGTGRSKLLRFKGHFHGWNDHMTSGFTDHFDGSPTPGVVAGVAGNVVLAPSGDLAAVAARLAADADIAAMILEPTGGSFGQLPVCPEFLHGLRQLCDRHGVLLIFDEVITGFRVSPGGAQAAFGVRPDLSAFAKIVAGGLPGGAVAGRRDLLDRLDFAASAARGVEKISHPGTFNANPLSAAAGTAALGIVADTDACARAAARAAELRQALNEAFATDGLPWAAYGTSSGFHIFLNPRRQPIRPTEFDPFDSTPEDLKGASPVLVRQLRLALLVNGVDVSNRVTGFTSIAHAAGDVAEAVEAFREAGRMLRAEGEV
jgi:glutamate-1-semialdehyde 2,1-aminomutase